MKVLPSLRPSLRPRRTAKPLQEAPADIGKSIRVAYLLPCRRWACGLGLCCISASPVSASVTLVPVGANAHALSEAVFRIDHPCRHARTTQALWVRVPAGFRSVEPERRPGWRLESRVMPDGRIEVRWTASAPHEALIEPDRADFVLRGQVTASSGDLVFEAVQRCEDGVQAYLDRPRARESIGDVQPPLRLEVKPPHVAPVIVERAWARATVPGQRSTAIYFDVMAPAGMRLLRARTPLAPASRSGVEHATLLGLTVRTRPIEWPLALPAREWLHLQPGGAYLALVDLDVELKAGSNLPLVLDFQDREGVVRQAFLQVPVRSPLSPQATSAIEQSTSRQLDAASVRSGARWAVRP